METLTESDRRKAPGFSTRTWTQGAPKSTIAMRAISSASFSISGKAPSLNKLDDRLSDDFVVEGIGGIVAFAGAPAVAADLEADDDILRCVQLVRTESKVGAQAQVLDFDTIHFLFAGSAYVRSLAWNGV